MSRRREAQAAFANDPIFYRGRHSLDWTLFFQVNLTDAQLDTLLEGAK